MMKELIAALSWNTQAKGSSQLKFPTQTCGVGSLDEFTLFARKFLDTESQFNPLTNELPCYSGSHFKCSKKNNLKLHVFSLLYTLWLFYVGMLTSRKGNRHS